MHFGATEGTHFDGLCEASSRNEPRIDGPMTVSEAVIGREAEHVGERVRGAPFHCGGDSD